MNKTKERAIEILRLYLEEVKALGFVESVVLVGSLSDGTYTGNAGSDIDLIHIVSDAGEYSLEKSRIFELIDRVEAMTEGDIPIARVVYQRRHLTHPYAYDFALSRENKDLIERPTEVFRMLDSGITVYGEDMIPQIERPTRDDVLMSVRLEEKQLAEMDGEFREQYLKMRERPTIRIMTQIVLTSAMSEYYFYTGKSCSSKYYILERMERDCPGVPYLNLLRLCHKNRFSSEEVTEQDIEGMEREYQTCFRNRPAAW